MKKIFLVFICSFYLHADENLTHSLQNPPPEIKKQEFEIFENATIKEVDFGERFDAYFKCKKSGEKDCDDYLKKRYFDIDADINNNFGLHVR